MNSVFTNMILEMKSLGPVLVGLVLTWAGIAKLFYRADFRNTLLAIPYLPLGIVPILIWIVPLSEIVISVGLIAGVSSAKWAAIALLSSFCVLALVMIKAKLRVSCSCFGPGGREFSRWTILQNLLLITMVIPGLFQPILPLPISQNLFLAAVVLIVWLSAGKLITNYDQIKELRRLKALN